MARRTIQLRFGQAVGRRGTTAHAVRWRRRCRRRCSSLVLAVLALVMLVVMMMIVVGQIAVVIVDAIVGITILMGGRNVWLEADAIVRGCDLKRRGRSVRRYNRQRRLMLVVPLHWRCRSW